MNKTKPTTLQISAIAGFVLSCFGLALYLWISFGGPTPLAPRDYEVKVPFTEATQLAEQADVRIAGVPIGKVAKIDLPRGGGRAVATLSIDDEHAPLPADTTAILRQKTLLGETYVELARGDDDGPMLAEGDTLPEAQVGDTVQLDEILRSFDRKTRKAFRTWMQDSAIGIEQRGDELSNAIALFAPTLESFDDLLETLDSQRAAVRQLFRHGSVTFAALRGRTNDLSELIRAGERVFTTTGERDQEIIDAFRAFPTFLAESRQTLARLREFSQHADPLVRQLTPAAKKLSPTLIEMGALAPELQGLFDGLEPVIENADRAFPAFQRLFREDFPPLLDDIDPFADQFNPLLEVIRSYRRELAALLGNAFAATNFETIMSKGPNRKYLRTMPHIGPEAFFTSPGRPAYNRTNAYSRPGIYSRLRNGLPSFETRHCAAPTETTIDASVASDPNFIPRANHTPYEPIEDQAVDLYDRIFEFAWNNSSSTNGVPGPPCKQQGPFGPFGGQGAATQFPHTLKLP